MFFGLLVWFPFATWLGHGNLILGAVLSLPLMAGLMLLALIVSGLVYGLCEYLRGKEARSAR